VAVAQADTLEEWDKQAEAMVEQEMVMVPLQLLILAQVAVVLLQMETQTKI
jgi:hypothetical protein